MVWSRGTALTEHSLARLLKPFSLFPKKIRQGRNLFRGYVPAKVLEAAERYVVRNQKKSRKRWKKITDLLQREGFSFLPHISGF